MATSLGSAPRRRPAARPEPGRARGGGGPGPRDAGRARRGAGRGSRRWPTTRSSGAAPACCGSGWAPSWPRTRPARGCARCRTCSAPCTPSARSSRSCRRPPRRTGPSSAAGWRGCRRPTAASVSRWRRAPAAELFVAPRQVRTVVEQLDEWLAGPYFAGFVASGPEALRRRPRPRPPARPTRRSPRSATTCATTTDRAPRGRRTPSGGSGTPSPSAAGPAPTSAPGLRGSRRPTPGAGREHRRILAEQRIEAEKVLPGSDPHGGHALAGHQRPGHRGRGGDPRPAAGDDGRGDRATSTARTSTSPSPCGRSRP